MAETASSKVEKLKPPEPPALAKASESGDAAVQQLVALREIHRANGDDAKAADVDRQLAQLGFTV